MKTEKETKIKCLLALGYTDTRIANWLGITEGEVEEVKTT